MTINRRNLVKGAAWSAPAILATATVPAYAASQTCNSSLALVKQESVAGEYTLTGYMEGNLDGLTLTGQFQNLPDPTNWQINERVAIYTGTQEYLFFTATTTATSVTVGGKCAATVTTARELKTRE